jgi:ATP-binding cassette subfamily C exporter for protease/lipase/ATP-binding cassette subfamily C protein EexD
MSLPSAWSQIRPLVGTLAGLSFFINLLFLAPAFFMLQVFDRVIPSNSWETLVVLLGGTLLALLILLGLDYVRNRLQHVVGGIVDEQLSPPVVSALVARAASDGRGASSDGVRDVAALRSLFASNGAVALFDAPWTVVYVLVITAIHPALGMGAAGAALLMLLLAWLNDFATRRAIEQAQREGRRSAQYVESSLRNAEVIHALGMTEHLLSRWGQFKDRLAALQSSASRGSVAFAALTRFTRQAIQVLMLALGAYLVLMQEASLGIMIASTILLGRALQPIEQVVSSWRLLSEARAAYRRLRELSSDFDEVEPRVAIPRPTGRVVADGVSYRLPGHDRPILSNIAFALDAGDTLAIIGPSAAGKSTLARVLTGIWRPQAGTVRIDGANVAAWPREQLGPAIGYVPQDVELFEGSVADNIARLGPVDSAAVVAAAERANAHEMILELPQGYDTRVGAQGTRLTPGQRQRVALARALYGDPRFVVLDEPNSNLDASGEAALAQALGTLREQGVTLIVITHRPALIAHVDKILLLQAGRIQQFGPAAHVIRFIRPLQAAASAA